MSLLDINLITLLFSIVFHDVHIDDSAFLFQ